MSLCGHIFLLEDLNAAFMCSVTDDCTGTGTPPSKDTDTAEADSSTLSLSGLLNSLDVIEGVFWYNSALRMLCSNILIFQQPQSAGEHLQTLLFPMQLLT